MSCISCDLNFTLLVLLNTALGTKTRWLPMKHEMIYFVYGRCRFNGSREKIAYTNRGRPTGCLHSYDNGNRPRPGICQRPLYMYNLHRALVIVHVLVLLRTPLPRSYRHVRMYASSRVHVKEILSPIKFRECFFFF